MKRRWLLAALGALGLAGAARAEEPATQDCPAACSGCSPGQASENVSGEGAPEAGLQLTDPMDHPGRRSPAEMGRQDWDLRSGKAPQGTGIGTTDHDRGTTARKRAPRQEW